MGLRVANVSRPRWFARTPGGQAPHTFLSRALHPDKNNLGPNRIIGLGNFTGRELWCEDKIGKVKFMLITP